MQVGSTEIVLAMRDRLVERGLPIALEEKQTSCCYAVQDKVWVVDPNGYRWEVFVVLEDNLPEMATGVSQTEGCCTTGQPDMVQIAGACGR